jgi:hypothetical protein
MATMIACSFVKLGNNFDFAWRTCIPAGFYLMLVVMKECVYSLDIKKIKYKLLIVCLLIGSITPAMEILRTTKHSYSIFIKNSGEPTRSEGLESVFIDNDVYENFIGKEDSFFNKYLRK